MVMVLKQSRLNFRKYATENVHFGPTLLGEVCAGCDSSLLSFVCEHVWNKLRENLSLSKFFINNLINLPVNVQLILNQFHVSFNKLPDTEQLTADQTLDHFKVFNNLSEYFQPFEVDLRFH